MFQGPRPPLLGIAMPIDESTKATRQGVSPKASWGWVQSWVVKEKAKNAEYSWRK